ncbi:MAG: preprotein translocase subunit SecE [Candidatus Sumerlaeota bacterium]|nr:preprotein translocase subunit SecE [Candidatus Sumerlaeota bacterium]
MERTKKFFHEVRAEMKKVTWPSRPELHGATIVVAVVTFSLSIVLGAADAVLSKVMSLLFQL